MQIVKNTFWASLLVLATAACSGDHSDKVVALKKTDKQLNCVQVELEINEAKFLAERAERNRQVGVSDIVAPLSYLSTYQNAEEAIDESQDRIRYLTGIYDILNCEKQAEPRAMSVSYRPASAHQQFITIEDELYRNYAPSRSNW